MSQTSSLRRDVGAFALLMTGIGSIIGSGWLFGAWRAAGLAGPGAVYAWLIGAAIVLAIALCFSELGAMLPESGGMVRYGMYSHGSLVGFIAAWGIWISLVSPIAAEAEASVQYMASWPWAWAQPWAGNMYHGGELSPIGLAIAAGLVIVYFLVNFWGVKLFARTNAAITLFKLIVPAAAGIGLICAAWNPGNFHVGVEGGEYSLNWAAIFTAVATSGIVFSYNGFQTPVNLAGETNNPGRNVPFAVVGAVLICAVIYVLLQVAYLGAMPPDMITKGWGSLDFSSPLAQLSLAVGVNWLAMILYADAFVSPSGTGINYTASCARMIYGMERNGHLPKLLGTVHDKYGVPRPAMWFDLVVAFLFLFFFRGWGALAAVISVATILSYLTGPLSVSVLRRTAPDMPRPVRLPGLQYLAPLAFMFGTLMLYWARWPLTGWVILLLLVALPVWAYYEARAGWRDIGYHLRGAAWMIVYLPVMALLSCFGSKEFGGHDFIPYGWDLLVVAVAGLGFYYWGLKCGWKTLHLEAATAGTRH